MENSLWFVAHLKADATNARIRQSPTPRHFRHPQRQRKPADPASKKAVLAPRLRSQREEHERRSAARHLRTQEMRSLHQRGTPVPLWSPA